MVGVQQPSSKAAGPHSAGARKTTCIIEFLNLNEGSQASNHGFMDWYFFRQSFLEQLEQTMGGALQLFCSPLALPVSCRLPCLSPQVCCFALAGSGADTLFTRGLLDAVCQNILERHFALSVGWGLCVGGVVLLSYGLLLLLIGFSFFSSLLPRTRPNDQSLAWSARCLLGWQKHIHILALSASKPFLSCLACLALQTQPLPAGLPLEFLFIPFYQGCRWHRDHLPKTARVQKRLWMA